MKLYNVHVVYHLLGDGVLEDERYKAFMNGFADGAHVRPVTDARFKMIANIQKASGNIPRAWIRPNHVHQRCLQPASPQSARPGYFRSS